MFPNARRYFSLTYPLRTVILSEAKNLLLALARNDLPGAMVRELQGKGHAGMLLVACGTIQHHRTTKKEQVLRPPGELRMTVRKGSSKRKLAALWIVRAHPRNGGSALEPERTAKGDEPPS